VLFRSQKWVVCVVKATQTNESFIAKKVSASFANYPKDMF